MASKEILKQVWSKMGEVPDDGTDNCPLCLHRYSTFTHYCTAARGVITWRRVDGPE